MSENGTATTDLTYVTYTRSAVVDGPVTGDGDDDDEVSTPLTGYSQCLTDL